MVTDEQREWFTNAVEGVAKTNQDDIKAWNWAAVHRQLPGWKEWVQGCVLEACGPRVRSPMGILLNELRGTKPNAKADLSRQGLTRPDDLEAHLERAREARLNRPPSMPSSVAMAELVPQHGYLGALNIVKAEWERQGKPYAEAFSWLPLGLEENPRLLEETTHA